MAKYDFVIAVGGAPGQGIETLGKSLGKICARYGLHVFTYSAYQSLIRGGHTFLTIRISSELVANHGDEIDLIIALDKNSIEKHLPNVRPGGAFIYNSDDVKQGPERDDIQLCPVPYKKFSSGIENRKLQKACLNTCMLSAALRLVGADLKILEEIIIGAFSNAKGKKLWMQILMSLLQVMNMLSKTLLPLIHNL
jgi:2-oxoglutarate ferredoxin oxidoreductase subunit alpha